MLKCLALGGLNTGAQHFMTPDLEALSLVLVSRPDSAIYKKCPRFSRLLLLSWDNKSKEAQQYTGTIIMA